jgi:hypothetical protein
MKNKTGNIESIVLVMPDSSVRVFINRTGEEFAMNEYTIPEVKASRMVVIDGSDSTNFVEYDMGGWTLEVGQTDEDNRVYVFARWTKTYNPIAYIEIDSEGSIFQ